MVPSQEEQDLRENTHTHTHGSQLSLHSSVVSVSVGVGGGGGVCPTLTSFSESPLHLLTILEAEMLKKVVLHSVATALASSVFPVPGKHIHFKTSLPADGAISD